MAEMLKDYIMHDGIHTLKVFLLEHLLLLTQLELHEIIGSLVNIATVLSACLSS